MARRNGGWKTNRVEPLPPDWAQRRQRVIARDGSVCQLCQQYTTRPEVDHRGDRGDHSEGNLRVLCRTCHARRTSAQGVAANKARAARRFRPREPHPLDGL